MATTTTDLILRIRDLVRDLPPRDRYKDEQYVRTGINPILRQLERLSFTRSVTATFVTVANQAAYAIPVTILPYYSIERVSHGAEQRILTWRERHRIVGPPTTGEPAHWNIWNNQFHLDPAPSTAGITVQIDAFCSTTLVATEVSPPVDELQMFADVEDALVYGAAAEMADMDSEERRADRLREKYTERVRALRAKLNPDRGDLPVIEDGSGLDVFIEPV